MLIEHDMDSFTYPRESQPRNGKTLPAERASGSPLPQVRLQLVEHAFITRTVSVPARQCWRAEFRIPDPA